MDTKRRMRLVCSKMGIGIWDGMGCDGNGVMDASEWDFGH